MTSQQDRIAAQLEAVAERAEALAAEMDRIEDTYGKDRAGWPAGQRERHDRTSAAFKHAMAEADALAARAEQIERIREAAADPANVERAVPEVAARADHARDAARGAGPWRGVDRDIMRTESPAGFVARAHDVLTLAGGMAPEARVRLAEAVDSEGGQAAAFVVARSNPAYRSAFEKILRNPDRAVWTLSEQERDSVAAVEAARASLSTNTGTGGYLIPLSLDPSVTIANSGTAWNLRNLATVKTTISSPARMLTSAGISATFLAEATAASDASPTFQKTDVDLFKLSAFASASYEIIEDSAADVGTTLGILFGDARDRAEAAAFVTGTGSGEPHGIVTAVAAVTASVVNPTTTGAFSTASIADVHKVFNALPARARNAGVSWLAANSVYSIIRRMDTSGGSSFWADLNSGVPATLLGGGVYEASAMSATITTGSTILAVGDLKQLHIYDHVQGPAIEYLPNLVSTTTGLPTGVRGWFFHERIGSEVADPNQVRVLTL